MTTIYFRPAKSYLESQLVGDFSIHFPENSLDKTLPSLWRSNRIVADLQQQKIDLFHGLSNELPFGIGRLNKIKKVVTIHDVLFLSHPAQYPWIDRQIYKAKVQNACDAADYIIAISEATKKALIARFDVKEIKIEVIYQPCDAVFNSIVAPEQLFDFRQKHQLPDRFIVQVSSFFPRKNQLNLVKAFHKIHHQIPQKLLLVGTTTQYLAGHSIQSHQRRGHQQSVRPHYRGHSSGFYDHGYRRAANGSFQYRRCVHYDRLFHDAAVYVWLRPT